MPYNCAIIGGSGFAGGELARLLLQHPEVNVTAVTSRNYAGKPIQLAHPNLDGWTSLKFSLPDIDVITKDIDVLFMAMPHGKSQSHMPALQDRGIKIIDLAADFRLKKVSNHERFYGPHSCPELLEKAVYGLPEVNREKIKGADLIAVPGCHASAAIYGLLPVAASGLIKGTPIIVDSKTGSTGAGASPSLASHHPLRANVIRPYKLVGHRHTAEIQEVIETAWKGEGDERIQVSFSAHSVDVVRGILSTIHVFLAKEGIEEREIYKAFRQHTRGEPFFRFVKRAAGIYKLPDPKTVVGTNYCDVGFEIDPFSSRLVIVSALDNLIKGAAGNAVQCFNIACNIDETTGLHHPAFFPY